ncbi:uncharacterized protein LOC129769517 [Toxorhynchites rutilus septentrionalis]|uniref:uncharacterized protein LOC129769517 n=1 Tax=Toxorhynchites rutilus septentrionalis TaxID=329112 RepID=UPI0024788E91|nr:uncharacterized protein LOC129769517 [Toxorhynchites rutilus septentrionalis]
MFLLELLLAATVALAISPSAADSSLEDFCNGINAGIFPHPDPHKCYKFISCVFEQPTVYECDEGFVFNVHHSECVPGQWEHCERNHELEELCSEVSYGVFEYRWDCAKFVFCQRGNASVFECLQAEIWSQERGTCVAGDRETCRPKDSHCVGKPDGPVALPGSCQSYIECRNEQGSIVECPRGYIFVGTGCVVGSVRTCESLEHLCRANSSVSKHPHPDFCDLYITCDRGQSNVHSCPVGEILRPDMQVCVPGNSNNCTYTSVEGMCDGRQGPVVYPHPQRCDQYVRCEQDDLYVNTCPPDTIVQPVTLQCVPGIQETCTFFDDLCLAQPNAIIPHPSRCDRFIECQSGRASISACPEGHVFVNSTSSCVPGNTVTCTRLDQQCTGREDSNLPHPNGCHLFVSCRNGVTSVQSCPEGEILRPDMQVCAPGNRETCQFTPINGMCNNRPGPVVYPHPVNCTLLVRCEQGQISIESCGEGTVLQPRTLECVAGNQNTCQLYIDRCVGQEDGTIPHPSECHLRLRCRSGSASVESCPRGTIYNTAGRCVLGDRETCESLEQVCATIPNKLIEHPNFCDLSIECRDGTTSMRTCAAGLIFHRNMQVCSPGDVNICRLEEVNEMCAGRNQGRFPLPDQSECIDYVTCSNGLPTVNSCRDGTVLRPRFLDCVPGRQATCEFFPHICLFRPNENIPHPIRCDLFVECISEMPHVVSCPEGMIYSPEMDVCLPGDSETCEFHNRRQ